MRVLQDVLATEGVDPVAGVFPKSAAVLEDGVPAVEERLAPRVHDRKAPVLVADDRLQVLSLPVSLKHYATSTSTT